MDKLDKVYILQWMPDRIGTPGNEVADRLAKEARNHSRTTPMMEMLL